MPNRRTHTRATNECVQVWLSTWTKNRSLSPHLSNPHDTFEIVPPNHKNFGHDVDVHECNGGI